MKKTLMFVVVAIFSFYLFVGNVSAAGKSVVLKAGSAWPKTHDNSLVYSKFFKMVEQKTNGSIKIEWAGGPELVKARDLPTASGAGTIDIFQSAPGYYGGIVGEGAILEAFPAFRAFENMPQIFNDALKILAPIYEKKLKIKPLGMTLNYPFYLWTKKPVHSFEALKGLKIRAHGGLVPFIAKALGASPVTMPSGSVYMALERGVIDGAIRNLASLNSFKEYEIAPYGISSPVTWASAITFISLRKWNKLSDKDKRALEEAGAEITEVCARFWKEKNDEYMGRFKSQKIEFFNLPPKTKSKWAKLTEQGGRKGALKLSPSYAEEIIAIFKKYGG